MANQINEIYLKNINNMAYHSFMQATVDRAEANEKVSDRAASLKKQDDSGTEASNLSFSRAHHAPCLTDKRKTAQRETCAAT